ncbi:Protein MAIN-LIKE 1 [Glycine max]|nr:Protein MAIN-LIKE 1 [Glycine max]
MVMILRVPVIFADDVPVVPAVPQAEPAVAGDEPMVDVDAQDTNAETDAQDTDAEDAADEAEGFPSGLRDPSVLTEYAEHVVASVWSGQEQPELKLSSNGRKVHKLGRPLPAIEEMVAGTRLSPLIACSIDTGDQRSISSFVERWHQETSTFHLPVGEVSITLDDIASLLHLPIVGDFHAFQPLHINEAVLMLVELLMVSPEVAMAEIGHCCGPYVRLHWLRDCWIYEHFSSVAECNADPDYDEVSPHACRWIATKKTVKKISTVMYKQRLDRLRIPYVCWMPYAEHRPVQEFHPITCFLGQFRRGPVVVRYRPERVMRQFGYVQCIPAHPVDSWVSFENVDDRWAHYSDHLAPAGDICVVPGQCALDYIDWFFVISHPFMTAPQTSDPPRDASATQPRHIPQELAPASTHADEPRYAVAYHAIAEMLEHHLSLNEVTPGTSTHEVIQKCLRIASGVTKDRNVHAGSRRRRRMNQS